ncbi:MAG TPA: hypothetical protein VMM92_12385 [Thermoanaerobaculia bacterium]|nr:hypothetical protein [Thermoanaerobaculia bacterium]
MKIQEFYSKLQSNREKSILFTALNRLSRLDDLKSLATATSDAGWMYWTDPLTPVQYGG